MYFSLPSTPAVLTISIELHSSTSFPSMLLRVHFIACIFWNKDEKSPHCVGLLLSLLCIYILNGATVSTPPFTLNIIIKSLIKLYAQAIKTLMDLFPGLSL